MSGEDSGEDGPGKDERSENGRGEDNSGKVAARLNAIFAGDRAAAAWLYDTFATSYFGRLRRRYPYVDPEDLLHDAFVLFFRRDCKVLRDFAARCPIDQQTKRALDRHLWGLVCGLVTNYRRSAGLLRWRPMPAAEELSRQPDAEAVTIERDRLEQLDDCLRQGGDRLYLYFKLRYREELSPSEISRVTGWSRKATYKLKQAFDQAARRCAEKIGIDR